MTRSDEVSPNYLRLVVTDIAKPGPDQSDGLSLRDWREGGVERSRSPSAAATVFNRYL